MNKIIFPISGLLFTIHVSAQFSPWVPQTIIPPSVQAPVTTTAQVQTQSVAQQKINRVQDLVRAAANHGLLYSLYFDSTIKTNLQNLATTNDPKLDTTLNLIVNQVASDLSRGRVLPNKVDDKVSIKVKPYLYQSISDGYVSGNMTASDFISAVVPKNRIYNEAQAIVKNIVELRAQNLWGVKPAGLALSTVSKSTVNPKLISYIRQELNNFGYTNNLSSTVYDSDLSTAIKSFQTDNGLDADGVAGSMSWKLLEKPVEQLQTQAILNLDRTRWLPDQNAAEYIYVNLAKQTFQYFENEVETLAFRTVNGRVDRQTPIMVDVAREVILNPTWTVPRNLFVKDKIPKEQADPNWATDAHMKMYSDVTGQIVDPTTVDWFLPASQLPYTFVQDPGPWNALGFIKFPLTNGFAVYMHDTNERDLFSESDRLRSSGCVRLQKPFDLGAKLLSGTKWTIDALREATELSPTQADKPSSISLKRSVPVYLAYKTIMTVNGKLLSYNDPYGVDTAMYNVMTSGK